MSALAVLGFHRGFTLADVTFLPLAAAFVFPDFVLDFIGENTGKSFGRWHLIFVEIIVACLMTVATILLQNYYAALPWWLPLVYVGILAVFRALTRFAKDLAGFNDDD